MLNMLSPLARLSVLETPRRSSAIWYRPDDVLRILPGTNRAMVRLADGSVVSGTIANLINAGRLTYNRTGAAYAQNKEGSWTEFASNAPRITDAGMTIEPSVTNIFANSAAPATQTITVTNGATYTVSCGAGGTLTLTGALTGTVTSATPVTGAAASTSLTVTVVGTPWYAQVEALAVATSPILGSGATTVRAADVFLCPTAGLSLPTSGTLIGQFTTPYNNNSTTNGVNNMFMSLRFDLANTGVNVRSVVDTTKGPRFSAGNGSTIGRVSPATGTAAGAVNRFVATFGAATLSKLATNGVGPVSTGVSGAVYIASTYFGLGVMEDGAIHMNGVVREWCFRSTVLSDADMVTESASYIA